MKRHCLHPFEVDMSTVAAKLPHLKWGHASRGVHNVLSFNMPLNQIRYVRDHLRLSDCIYLCSGIIPGENSLGSFPHQKSNLQGVES